MKKLTQSIITNELILNENYSYLKTSYMKLNNELSTKKEKNNYLNQKVVELELMNL